MYKLLIFTIPGEEALEAERNDTLWDPILNYAVDVLEFSDHDGVACYKYAKELIMGYQEKEAFVAYIRARGALDVWLC